LKSLTKNGWAIKFPNNDNRIYNEKKNKPTIIVGVVGNGNKGKSFVLQKLSDYYIPEGFSIKTEGLSIKYSKTENKNLAILDSAGEETPLLDMNEEENIENQSSHKDNNKKQNKIESQEHLLNNDDSSLPVIDNKDYKEEEEKIKNDNNQKKEIKNINEINQNNEFFKNSVNEEIEEYARDKLLSENFLQKFIIHKSNILLVVVGNMTLSEQKLLARVKAQSEQQIIVIHNLLNFTSKEQVKDYINNTLLKLKMIKLERNVYQTFADENTKEDKKNNEKEKENKKEIDKQKEKENIFYFVEEKEKTVHVILSNEYSEAGKYYNNSTIKYLKKKIDITDNRRSFKVIDEVMEFFLKTSNDIIEENIIDKDNIYFDENSCSIKLKNIKTLTLKKYLIDELGFTLQKNRYSPKYSHYLKDNKLIFKIEFPGKGTIKQPSLEIGKGDYIFIFKGEKKNDQEIEDDNKNHEIKKLKILKTNREYGTFILEIKIPQNLIHVNNINEKPKFYKEINERKEQTGIIIFEYNVEYIGENKNNTKTDDVYEI
jgi:hypothetical protein